MILYCSYEKKYTSLCCVFIIKRGKTESKKDSTVGLFTTELMTNAAVCLALSCFVVLFCVCCTVDWLDGALVSFLLFLVILLTSSNK